MKSVKFFLIVLCWMLAPLWVCAEAPPTWSDEFNGSGLPDPATWTFEEGYKRNNEDQYYTTNGNAWQESGMLVIEARRETTNGYNYTSASIESSGKFYWLYGRAQIRAKIPCLPGMWPAIWGCGQVGNWPDNGECDIMEYYGGAIKANCARGSTAAWTASWDSSSTPVSTNLVAVDPGWATNYHIWTIQWDQQNVRLYVDSKLLNTIPQTWLVNATTNWGPQNPFKQPFTVWLNLAIGGNSGGDPSGTTFPQRYYVDYWRIWEGATNNMAPTDISLSTNAVKEGLPAGTIIGDLSATDADPAEVIKYTLVAGAGDTHNSQFTIPEFLSDTTTLGVLKTAAMLNMADGATRSIRVQATDIEGLTYVKNFTINVIGSSLATLPASGITASQATLNATLNTSTNFVIHAFWGTSNGGTNPLAWSSNSYVGSYTNAASTNLTKVATDLTEMQTYYCTFRGTNETQTLWATNVINFATSAGPENANLSSFASSAGILSPVFASNTFSYAADVSFATTSLTVTATAASAVATIKVNDITVTSGIPSGPIALSPGSNVITTVVVSQSLSATNTYTLTVQRLAASTNTFLSNLVLSAGTLTPVFASNTYSYAATVPYSITNITVTPTAVDINSDITVQGSPVVSGNASLPIALTVGNTVINTVIVSDDLSSTNTYTVTATRLASSLTLQWDGGAESISSNGDGASAGGAGTWSTTLSNWDAGNGVPHTAWDNGATNTALFAGTGGAVTLGSPVTANLLRFDSFSGSYTLGTEGQPITLGRGITVNAGAGTVSVVSPIVLSAAQTWTNNSASLLTVETASVTNSGHTLTVGGGGSTTISSGISGTGGLIRASTGSLTLTGNNTYSGATTVSNGTLRLAGGTFNAGGGTGTRNINVNSGGTLVIENAANVNLPGILGFGNAAQAVTNNMVMTGGTLTINGVDTLANLYRAFVIGEYGTETSVFTMSGGTLNANNTNARIYIGWDGANCTWNMYGGVANVGMICLNKAGSGGTLNLTNGVISVGSGGITNGTVNYKLNLGGGALASSASWLSTLNATLTGNGGNVKFAPASGQTITWSGILSGAGGFNKIATGTLLLGGANTFSNGLTISEGVLKLGANNVIPEGAGRGNVVMNPASGTAVLDLAGRTEAINGLSSSGAGTSVLTNSSATAVMLTVGNNNQSSVFEGNIAAGVGGISMTKTGSGELTLSGANTYTGVTTVAAGKLICNGSLSSMAGAVNISSGGVLSGTGTIARVVTVASGGTLSPGVSVGQLTAATNVTVASGAVLAVNIDSAQAPYCGKLAAGGELTITGATLNITTNGLPNQPVYVIATYGTLAGAFAITNGLPAGYTLDYNYNSSKAIALVYPVADADGDGMDDNWEIINFTSTGGSNGTGDQDLDGFSDLHEYLAGTSPTNSSSLLILESASAVAAGSQVVLTWAGVEGKTYQLLTSTNLMQSAWATNRTGINGVSPTTSVTNNISESGCYYLIKLE